MLFQSGAGSLLFLQVLEVGGELVNELLPGLKVIVDLVVEPVSLVADPSCDVGAFDESEDERDSPQVGLVGGDGTVEAEVCFYFVDEVVGE